MRDADKLRECLIPLLREAVKEEAFPGAVLGVTDAHEVLFCEAVGHHTYAAEPALQVDALFDLASLTKVVATTAVVMRLCDAGALTLSAPVIETLPEFALQTPGAAADAWRRCVTLRHLLAHAAGLPAYVPFHRRFPGVSDPASVVLQTGLQRSPGQAEVYSDIGMIIVGFLVTQRCGSTLDRVFSELIAAPLGLSDTLYCPGAGHVGRTVPTEIRPGSEAPVRGTVHDENAAWLGGIAGHAGLFSTAGDLLCFARLFLNGGALPGGAQLLQPACVREFSRPARVVAGSTRCLGWDSPGPGSSAGEHASGESFGHTGFTGTSLWIDPLHGLGVVLLSNAVYPHRDSRARSFFPWRRRLHAAVYNALGVGDAVGPRRA